MSDGYRVIEYWCRHCGDKLAARERESNSSEMQIAGIRNLEFVHATTSKELCRPHTVAVPYDGFAASKAYDRVISNGR